MAESGLLSAGGPLRLTQAVPGNLSTGPSGPVRPPYGRTEHGRSREARHRISVDGKGLRNRNVKKPCVDLFGFWIRNGACRSRPS